MSDVYVLSPEIMLSKATPRTLGDIKKLGIKIGTHTKLKFLKLEI